MTFNKSKIILPLLMLVAASLGNAVSRVGGGKVSSTVSGFELTVPSPFIQLGALSSDAVRAMGPAAYINGTGLRKLFIDILEFASDFSSLANASRDDLRREFLSAGWAEENTSDCSVHFKKQGDSVVAHVVSWGSGKGYILRGLFIEDVATAMDEIVRSQQRVSTECVWK